MSIDTAFDALRRMPTGKKAQGPENVYGEAYQGLVKQGQRLQLKKKYRGPKAAARGGNNSG